MKNLLLAVIYFFPALSIAQYQYLKLENKQVYFEKVYAKDSLNESSVEKMLIQSIPRLKDLFNFKNENDLITANLKNAEVDFRKYGGHWGNTATFVQYPFSGEVQIIWKDGKYKVSVTNIVFHVQSLGDTKADEIFTSKKGTVFSEGKNISKAGFYLEQHLSDLFEIKTKNDW
jgi:hypothetical protein